MEDLISVPIAKGSDRFFLVSSGLDDREWTKVVDFLKENIEAFAWVPSEMPNIDPDFICHHLNVKSDVRPVVQKSRCLAVIHTDVVLEEVD